jgi:hypothetical protein
MMVEYNTPKTLGEMLKQNPNTLMRYWRRKRSGEWQGTNDLRVVEKWRANLSIPVLDVEELLSK